MEPETFEKAVIAVLSGLGGFVLGRLQSFLGRRDERRRLARTIVVCGSRILDTLEHQRVHWQSADLAGVAEAEGFFKSHAILVADADVDEFNRLSRDKSDLSDPVLASLRDAADWLSRLVKKHEAIRSTMNLSTSWKEERSAFGALLSGTGERVRSALDAVSRQAPRDTRKKLRSSRAYGVFRGNS